MPSQDEPLALNLDPELPEDVLQEAINQGEDPDKRLAFIDELRNMIMEKGDCMPCRTDDEFLIKFLRARFWNLEHSYKLIVSYCEFLEKNKDLHEKVHPLNLKMLAKDDVISVGPERDNNGKRAIIMKFGNWKPSKISVDDIFRATLVLIEIGSLEPIAQVRGGVAIFDMKGLNLNHVMQLSPTVAQKMLSLMVTAMPLRTTAVHIVNQNWTFSTAFNIFKPFLSARMKERIFFHGTNMSSLHKHISPQYLPKEYGGTHGSFTYQKWMESLAKNTKVLKELETIGYVFDEKDKNISEWL